MESKTRHTFIVAVSGGVDSMALLHMIKDGYELLPDALLEDPHIIVAHIDHGIRANSARDKNLVEKIARDYNYEFESVDLNLGVDASEEEARNMRYEFLDVLASKYHADAVVTAHHSDDVLETAVINIVRGTGRRGLSSLRSTVSRSRPLLSMPKSEIVEYAQKNSVEWNDDETNTSSKYLRNRIRSAISGADNVWKATFATHLQNISQTNDVLDTQIATILQYKLKGKQVLSRNWFVKLDHAVACECMASFLKKVQIRDVDRKLVERLVIALKAGRPGTSVDVDASTCALITKRSLRLVDRKTLKTRVV